MRGLVNRRDIADVKTTVMLPPVRRRSDHFLMPFVTYTSLPLKYP